MKKIVSAIAVAALAVAAQAVNITWSTGAMYTAKNDAGEWTATTGNTGKIAANAASISIYLVTESDFETYLGMSAEDIWNADKNNTMTKIAKNTVSSNAGGLGVWKDTARDYSTGDKAFAVFVVNYTDPNHGDFYAVGFGGAYISASGTAAVSVNSTDYQFNTAINRVGAWTPVPEPTTLALLALGLAAVGLKRKVA